MSRRLSVAGLTAMLLVCALVGNPATAATTWSSPPLNLTADVSGAGGGAEQPDIALSDDGTRATAVWNFRPTGATGYFVQSASATISGSTATWSTPVTLSTDTLSVPLTWMAPHVALSADGTKATAVWVVNEGASSWTVQTASATIEGNTASWSSVQSISVSATEAGQPQIALSDDGTRATAVWYRSESGIRVIQSRSATILDNAATWSSVTDLSNSDSYQPEIALSADGTKATVVWARYNGPGIQSKSATIVGNTATWATDADDLTAGGFSYEPQVVLSDDGANGVAAWKTWNGTGYIIRSTSATIIGSIATWSSAQDLSACCTWGPQLAISSDGSEVTAVWARLDGTSWYVQTSSAKIESGAASWATAGDISTAGGFDPSVVLTADGSGATAVWHSNDGTQSLIQSANATISNGVATWSSASNLSTGGQFSFYASVGMSADGTMASAVWLRDVPSPRIQTSSATLGGGADADPHALGYWKHASLDGLLSQPLGAYSVDTPIEALAVLRATNCGARPSAVAGCLAGQLLVAELNVEAGVSDTCIATDIAAANEFLEDVVDYEGPGPYSLTKAQRREALVLITRLASFNSDGCP